VIKKIFHITCIIILWVHLAFSQDQDTSKTMLSTSGSAEQFKADSLVKEELAPLDIGKDRGLYIVTADGKMQLRILGSVRFFALYDMVEIPVKKTFNTYFIPTGDNNVKIPNYYNSLNETRLGFEITRILETQNVFVRLETDFNGSQGQFRIRHAYGQLGNFLVGQTWSLFSNVTSFPAMVNNDGPTGSVTLRTPQIRYSGQGKRGISWAVALEYSRPDLTVDDFDTSGISIVQLIPDLTGRFVWEGNLGVVQLSAVINAISKKDPSNEITNTFGIGGSLSGTVDIPGKDKLLYQFTYGKSISHFISTFSGTGNDAVFNPETKEFEGLVSFGGFLSYGINLRLIKLTSHISIGYAQLSNKDFQPDDSYRNSLSLSIDSFWNLAEGARLGVEIIYGQRWDKSGETGRATRISSLFYYDF
jgi:hypothetical protein